MLGLHLVYVKHFSLLRKICCKVLKKLGPRPGIESATPPLSGRSTLSFQLLKTLDDTSMLKFDVTQILSVRSQLHKQTEEDNSLV